MQVCVFQHDDKTYSAVTPVGLLADRQPREAVKKLILSSIQGTTATEVDKWLWNPATAAEYRAAWATAVAASVGTLEAAISELEASEETEKLQQQLQNVAASVEKLFAEIKQDRKRKRLETLEANMSRWVADIRAALVAKGLYDSDRSILGYTEQSELGQEIKTLREELANVA